MTVQRDLDGVGARSHIIVGIIHFKTTTIIDSLIISSDVIFKWTVKPLALFNKVHIPKSIS